MHFSTARTQHTRRGPKKKEREPSCNNPLGMAYSKSHTFGSKSHGYTSVDQGESGDILGRNRDNVGLFRSRPKERGGIRVAPFRSRRVASCAEIRQQRGEFLVRHRATVLNHFRAIDFRGVSATRRGTQARRRPTAWREPRPPGHALGDRRAALVCGAPGGSCRILAAAPTRSPIRRPVARPAVPNAPRGTPRPARDRSRVVGRPAMRRDGRLSPVLVPAPLSSHQQSVFSYMRRISSCRSS
jgi:hypothetical protein